MAEDSKVWDHIADLHKKHSELAIQLHDMRGGEQSGLSDKLDSLERCMQELTAAIRELVPVMKQDVKADRAVASGRAK